MRVLLDYHHSDLLNSLHLLFERLGMEVYVVHGLEWFTEGYWQFGTVYPDGGIGVAKQFLLAPPVDQLQPQRIIRFVSLEEAREMEWAVVLATVAENQQGFHRFAQENGARYAVQVGNVNQWVDRSLSPVILDSSGQYPSGVQFTPEFDMDGAFAYQVPHGWKLAASFVNLFPGLPCFPLFEEARAILHGEPDWAMAVYGHNSPQGFITPTSAVGGYMAANDFAWHDKVTGDGFGYVIHYWASVGRVLVGHASHYRGQTAEYMWDDLVTCIDLDRHTPREAALLMDSIAKDDRLEEMGEILAQRVRERIDFAADAQRVGEALGVLVTA